MSRTRLNHSVPNDQLSVALITGDSVQATCGATFVPSLRVGSSGSADEPTADLCPVCERVLDLMEVQRELAIAHRRMQDEIDALKETERIEVAA